MKKPALILFLLLGCLSAFAIPVFRHRITLVQPDGSQIEAFISGDERAHAVTDAGGHVLVQGSDKYWRYAVVRSDGSRYPSGYIVGEKVPQRVLDQSFFKPPRIRRSPMRTGDEDSSEEPSEDPSGEPVIPPPHHSCLILLVQFPDKEFQYTREDFIRLVSEPGFSDDGATGCLADYFEEQFREDATFSFEVSEIIKLDQSYTEYFKNDEKGNDEDPCGAVVDACRKAYQEQGLEFSRFDQNGDGEVDNIFVIVAGKSEAETGDEDSVWPHMANVRTVPKYNNVEIDGVLINAYNISAELQLNDDNQFVLTGIGTLCHEYSHSLGLVDMYDVDYAGSGGMGNGLWRTTALMDGGNYNNNGHTPPHYNAIDYHLLGLGIVDTLKVGTFTLEPVSVNRRFMIYKTPLEGEFFLLECRAQEGWDSHIGGAGLLIYHIDRSRRLAGYSDSQEKELSALMRWRHNEVNCRPDHQCARLISASPGIRAYNSSKEFQLNQGQIFYPYKDNNAFTSLTSPPFIFWDGTESPLAITDITLDGDNVTFSVTKMSDVTVPEVTGVESFIFQDAAIIRWEADNPEFEGDASVSWGLASREGTQVDVETYGKGKYAIILDGLNPGKAYRASISFSVNGISSKVVTVNFTTKYLYEGALPFIYLNNTTRNTDGSFTIGSRIPLKIYNLHDAKSVTWEYDGWPISPSPDGFFHILKSGTLTAAIEYKDGTTEYITKEITVK